MRTLETPRRLTVGELKKELEKVPDDVAVFVDGKGLGFDLWWDMSQKWRLTIVSQEVSRGAK